LRARAQARHLRSLQVAALAIVILAATAVPANASSAFTASCGGTDRWSVKTGTDTGATQVDMNSIHSTTIIDLRGMQAPPKRPQDQRANATETTVFSITAFLINYKVEPDQDYHLRVADANKNEMVVEVPNPPCIHGASPFTAQITAARKVVDDQLTVGSKFQPTDTKIPVRVTGIGFFDKKGHGKGGTPNGIELHPVIKIEFNPSGTTTTTSPPPSSGLTQQLLRDPGFEIGPSGSAWTASSGVITNSSKRQAHAGKFYAWLGGYGQVNTDTLSQQVSLPGGATRITLSYWIAIDTQEKSSRGSVESTDAFDTLTIEVRSSGGRTDELAAYSNVNAHGGYTRASADLTAYKGQTVTLVFTAVEDRSLQTSFLLDDVGVDVE